MNIFMAFVFVALCGGNLAKSYYKEKKCGLYNYDEDENHPFLEKQRYVNYLYPYNGMAMVKEQGKGQGKAKRTGGWMNEASHFAVADALLAAEDVLQQQKQYKPLKQSKYEFDDEVRNWNGYGNGYGNGNGDNDAPAAAADDDEDVDEYPLVEHSRHPPYKKSQLQSLVRREIERRQLKQKRKDALKEQDFGMKHETVYNDQMH